VKAELPGYKPWSQKIYLTKSGTTVTATLKKAKRAP
jgi:hypothetical protein